MAEKYIYADMAELADAPDLGSGVHDVQVQVLLSALKFKKVWKQGLNLFKVLLSAVTKCHSIYHKLSLPSDDLLPRQPHDEYTALRLIIVDRYLTVVAGHNFISDGET